MTPEEVDAATQKEALRKACNDAINVQDAVNLSGVLHSWAKHQMVLREVCGGNVSKEYLQHPVNILFLSKVTSLMRVNSDCVGCVDIGGYIETPVSTHTDMDEAYSFCEQGRK